MITRCPQCATAYRIDPHNLELSGGLASCYRCGTAFAPQTGEAVDPADLDTRALARMLRLSPRFETHQAPPDSRPDLPFEVPEDLAPLEASPDAGLDVEQMLAEQPRRSRFWYGLLIVLLVGGLGLQLAWQERKTLLKQFPQLEPLCNYLPCRPKVVHAPDRFRVLQRDMAPTANEPGSLTLSVTLRNEAEIAQRLPDIQLSLLDNNGTALIRRRLSPAEYLYPPPAEDATMAPGEVITFSLDFRDPGYQASGFMIDFL